MVIKKIPLMIFAILFIAGCGIKSRNYTYDNESSSGYGFHGNFCGHDMPNVNARNAEEEISLLSNIDPIDLLDKACKIHDICYIKYEKYKHLCDDQLRENMEIIYKKISGNTKKNRLNLNIEQDRCLSMIGKIKRVFVVKNIPSGFLDDALYKIVAGLYFTILSPFEVLHEIERHNNNYYAETRCGNKYEYLLGEEIINYYLQ